MNLVFLKLGGSLITDKSVPFSPKLSVICRCANEIKHALEEKEILLIVGHGGGSYPHTYAKQFEVKDGFKNLSNPEQIKRGWILTANVATNLNRLIVNTFIEYGLQVVSIPPSATCYARQGKIEYMYTDMISHYLEQDIIPIPYGDAVYDSALGCTIISTEQIFIYLAKLLKPSKILIAGIVDGVFTGDPIKNVSEKFILIPEITKENISEVLPFLGDSYGTDVTGGMLTKVNTLLPLTELSVPILIFNGLKPENIKHALLGKKVKGTVIRR